MASRSACLRAEAANHERLLDGREHGLYHGGFEKPRNVPTLNRDITGRGAYAELRCNGHHHNIEPGFVIPARTDDDGGPFL